MILASWPAFKATYERIIGHERERGRRRRRVGESKGGRRRQQVVVVY
jgi:hypothetical protein